ncbi:MAG TPA: tRNA (guanosine(46)-N7)-methyltransferase TrmB, partial [Gammaproteobacteria bacterium]|nr:tRNA (guanosine(46)-N7)-methyltransferase TrmB [Gammaproteobacteria bacterium]
DNSQHYDPMNETQHRRIRSFVRRPGRTTAAQRRAIERLWPRYGLPDDDRLLELPAVFGRNAPIVLEIGFGDGEALFSSAVRRPDIDHLGIEIHEPGIGHLLLLLERADLSNVRLIARDAVDVLEHQLGPSCVDAVRIFFPDPWPKKRHHKRRLIQPAFIAQLAQVLRPGGFLHVATDWEHYAEQIREVMAGAAELRELAADQACAEPLAERPPTKFERRGRGLGHDVWDFVYRRT